MSHIFNKLGTLQDTTYNNEEKFFGWLYLIQILPDGYNMQDQKWFY